jgi:hypothetical protein
MPTPKWITRLFQNSVPLDSITQEVHGVVNVTEVLLVSVDQSGRTGHGGGKSGMKATEINKKLREWREKSGRYNGRKF